MVAPIFLGEQSMIKMLTAIASDEFVVKRGEETNIFSDKEENNLIKAELAEAVTAKQAPKQNKNKGRK